MPEGAVISDTDDKNDLDVNDPHRALDIDLDADDDFYAPPKPTKPAKVAEAETEKSSSRKKKEPEPVTLMESEESRKKDKKKHKRKKEAPEVNLLEVTSKEKKSKKKSKDDEKPKKHKKSAKKNEYEEAFGEVMWNFDISAELIVFRMGIALEAFFLKNFTNTYANLFVNVSFSAVPSWISLLNTKSSQCKLFSVHLPVSKKKF